MKQQVPPEMQAQQPVEAPPPPAQATTYQAPDLKMQALGQAVIHGVTVASQSGASGPVRVAVDQALASVYKNTLAQEPAQTGQCGRLSLTFTDAANPNEGDRVTTSYRMDGPNNAVAAGRTTVLNHEYTGSSGFKPPPEGVTTNVDLAGGNKVKIQVINDGCAPGSGGPR